MGRKTIAVTNGSSAIKPASMVIGEDDASHGARRPIGKKAPWALLILAVAALALISRSAAAEPSATAILTVDPVSSTVLFGDTTTLDIMVREVADLYGVQLTISFDPGKVEVVDADTGTPGVQIAPGTCPSPDWMVMNTVSNATGVISYAVIALNPSPPCNGEGMVASIEFHALSGGESIIHFSEWILANRDGGEIETTVQDGTLSVQVMNRVFLPMLLKNR
jgi:hypothetical protein